MKVIVLGRGSRIPIVLRGLSALGQKAILVTDDAHAKAYRRGRTPIVRCPDWKTLDLSNASVKRSDEDPILVIGDDEAGIRAILESLRAQNVPNGVTAFAPGRTASRLASDHRWATIQPLHQVFAREIADTIRRWNSRRRLQMMLRQIEGKSRLLILIYGNPDPDATSSAWALRALLGRPADSVTLSYTGSIGRLENEAMIDALRIPLKAFAPEMLDAHDAFAIVDAQPSFLQLSRPIPFDIVIDHHPVANGAGEGFRDIRHGYGATATILTEYFIDTDRRLPRPLATALYFGLKVDTHDFQRNVGDPDIAAFRRLHPLVDYDLIRKIELSHIEPSGLDTFATALQRKRVVKDILFAHLGPVTNGDLCSQVADFLMGTYGISWTVISGVVSDRLVVVFRSDGYRKDAGQAAQAAFAELGSAGGHRTMARAEVALERLTQELPGSGSGEIENFVFDRIMSVLRKPRASRKSKPSTT
jgi:nanoRNase/pAp phosphatase (c-di-AMP/oligoRNAs hydrolase)